VRVFLCRGDGAAAVLLVVGNNVKLVLLGGIYVLVVKLLAGEKNCEKHAFC
jgi:hypothetical protein